MVTRSVIDPGPRATHNRPLHTLTPRGEAQRRREARRDFGDAFVLFGVPELPEVETIRRTLAPVLVGRRILAAALLRRDVLIAPGDPRGGFSRQRGATRRDHPASDATRVRPARPVPVAPVDLLEGCTVTDVLRRGKQLAIVGAGPAGTPGRAREPSSRALVVQLGMTGALEALAPGAANGEHARRAGAADAASPHVHARWELEPARGRPGTMVFIDPRRFGCLRAVPTLADLDALWSSLGPDALEIDGPRLWEALRGSRRPVKAALLDQAVLAGVGNIYADEALFRAGVPPRKLAARLGPRRAADLAAAVRGVLAEAVEARGSTLRDYRDAAGRAGEFQSRHAVYGRGGEACTRCGGVLRSAVVAQRTTVWCPRCQR